MRQNSKVQKDVKTSKEHLILINNQNKSIRIASLFSGSEGNCTYFQSGEDEILIDAGMSAKAISSSLSAIGRDLSSIKAIFVTHEHTDHTKGLYMISKKYGIPIHMSSPTFEAYSYMSSALGSCACHDLIFSVEMNSIRVSSFTTCHDSRACVGYIIDNGFSKAGIATDLGIVSDNVKDAFLGCESVVIESNHDIEMLKYCSYPGYLKKRIFSDNGHLSNKACSELVEFLAENGTKNFLLAHISREANTHDKALSESAAILGKFDSNMFRLLAAESKTPTVLV